MKKTKQQEYDRITGGIKDAVAEVTKRYNERRKLEHATGLNLARIKDGCLWRSKFRSWDQFCIEFCGITAEQAEAMINKSKLFSEMAP